MSTSDEAAAGPFLVVSAHAGDFVWRAGGAMALAAAHGAEVTVLCLSYGERGESAKAWRDGKQLADIKEIRRDEASKAAEVLGAMITDDRCGRERDFEAGSRAATVQDRGIHGRARTARMGAVTSIGPRGSLPVVCRFTLPASTGTEAG